MSDKHLIKTREREKLSFKKSKVIKNKIFYINCFRRVLSLLISEKIIIEKKKEKKNVL